MPFQIQIKDALEFFGTINFDEFLKLSAMATGEEGLVEACISGKLTQEQKSLFGQNQPLKNENFIRDYLPCLNNLSPYLKSEVCNAKNLAAFLQSYQDHLNICFPSVLNEATSAQAKTTFFRKDHSTLVLEYILSQNDVQRDIAALKAEFQDWVRDRNLCNNVEFVKINLPDIITRFKEVIFSKCRNLVIDENILIDLNKDTNSPAGYPKYWIDQTDQNILAYLADVNLTVSSRGNGMSQSQTVWGEKFSGAGYASRKSVHIELESGHYQAMLTTDSHIKQKVDVPGDGFCGDYAFSLGLMAVENPAYKEQVLLQQVSSSGRGASTTTGKHKKGLSTSTGGRFLSLAQVEKNNGYLSEQEALNEAIAESKRASQQKPEDLNAAHNFVSEININLTQFVKALNAFEKKDLQCQFNVTEAEREKAQFAVDYLSGEVLRDGNFKPQLIHALSKIHQLSPDAFKTVTLKYLPEIFRSYAQQESEKRLHRDPSAHPPGVRIGVRA